MKDIVVHFMLVEGKDNRTTANWGVDLPNDPSVHVWKWKDIDSAVKHLDKTDRKNLLHISDKTDAKGEVSKEVTLSQFGGDKFYLAAYIDQDPHLAKYIHEHATLGKRKPAMAIDEINVWRKFWYQQVKVDGITSAGVGNAADCYKDVKVVMEAAPDKVLPRADIDSMTPKAIYPKHMLNYYISATGAYINNYPNDTSDGLIMSDNQPTSTHEKKFFPGSVNTDERPVMVAMINADGQWDPDGETTSKDTHWIESGFPIDIMTDKELLDPPLQGGTLLISGHIIAEDWDSGAGTWVNPRPVNLSASDLMLNPTRSDPYEVRISRPTGLTMASRTRFKLIDFKVRGAESFLGMSMRHGIVNVYTPNNVSDFIDTVNHELGHSFKQTAVIHPTGIPAHPHQYESQGSHCRYKNKSCLMYESGPQSAALHRYCPVCHPHVLVQDMTKV